MDWIDRGLLVTCTLAIVLTLRYVARTIAVPVSVKSDPTPLPAADLDLGVETDPDSAQGPGVWADDVLAEEEMKVRPTEGAAAHFTDVCTWWDEQDARDAQRELSLRVQRSTRSP